MLKCAAMITHNCAFSIMFVSYRGVCVVCVCVCVFMCMVAIYHFFCNIYMYGVGVPAAYQTDLCGEK